MADEYIKRSDALELSRIYFSPDLWEEAVPVKAIRNIPSADVVEVVYGEWLPSTCEYSNYNYDCSVCGCNEYRQIGINGKHRRFNFCPNCGADMRGGT